MINFHTQNEVDDILKNVKSLRAKTIIAVMAFTGVRISECLNLKLNDFDFRKKTITIYSLKKRDEKHLRVIPISNKLYYILADFFRDNDTQNGNDYIFKKKDGTRLSRQSINYHLKKVGDKIGVKAHPHKMRHTFATSTYSQGGKLEEVKNLLGHKRYDTTLVYAQIPQEKLRQLVTKTYDKPLSFFGRLFKKDEAIINIKKRNSGGLVGRLNELKEIEKSISIKESILLTGGVGVGKSALITYIKENLKIKHFALDDLNDIKQTIMYMLVALYNGDYKAVYQLKYPNLTGENFKKRITRQSISSLSDEVLSMVKKNEFYLIIDKADGLVNKKSIAFLEKMFDKFPMIIGAREIPYKSASAVWSMKNIKIKELKSDEVNSIINANLNVDYVPKNLRYTIHSVINQQSSGNPRAVIDLVNKINNTPVINEENVLNLKHDYARKEFDMTYIILLALALIGSFRYVANPLGMPLLRVFGAMAMMLLIFFRFFMYKLTKRTIQ